jgi:hypothetical protein
MLYNTVGGSARLCRIVENLKSRSLRWAEHVDGISDKEYVYDIVGDSLEQPSD